MAAKTQGLVPRSDRHEQDTAAHYDSLGRDKTEYVCLGTSRQALTRRLVGEVKTSQSFVVQKIAYTQSSGVKRGGGLLRWQRMVVIRLVASHSLKNSVQFCEVHGMGIGI